MIDLWPACQRMTDVLAGITDDQLAGATPCAEYTVAGLLGHVDTLSIRLAALARGEDAGPAGDSPRELIGQHVHALAAAWQEPSAWQGTTDLGVDADQRGVGPDRAHRDGGARLEPGHGHRPAL